MYMLTLIAQKGGTGKTTLAINLSVAAEMASWRAAISDLDPQARVADLSVIATAPHSQASALEAAWAADLALVPLRPGVLDLRALGTTAEICALARSRTSVALNATPHRGPLAD